MKKSNIDIMIPVYNEEDNILNIYNQVMLQEKKIGAKFNFIFVDDGSTDRTLFMIKKISKKNNVKYISFARNYGKEAAIFAGIEYSTSDILIVMDADMQDPPELIPDMVKSIVDEKYNICGTYRSDRKGEGMVRSFLSNIFYDIMRLTTGVNIPNGCRDYVAFDKNVKDAILKIRDRNRFFKGIFCSVGYNIKWIGFENRQRFAGNTKWSIIKLFRYSFDAISSFSNVPLLISSFVGFIFCVISFVAMLFIIIRALIFGDKVAGWPSLITIILFLFGLQFLFIGFIGVYLSKMYIETKNRPLYIIKETEKSIVNK